MKRFLLLLLLFAGPPFWTNGQTSAQNQPDSAALAKPVIVPQVVGYTLDEAKGILSGCRLREGTVVQKLSTAPAGEVIAQQPHPGAKAARGSAVDLTVSALENVLMVKVPDVKGLKADDAAKKMADAGLRVDQIYYKISLAKEETVFKQHPVAGELVKAGTPVFLMVSRHKHIAAWIIWITVLLVLILNERLFKWKARKEIKELHRNSNHHNNH